LKKISFVPINNFVEAAVEYPKPASKFVPEWYRVLDTYIEDNGLPLRILSKIKGVKGNQTVKRCLPFFDSMTSGYMATLPCDVIFVDKELYEKRAIWQTNYPLIDGHDIDQTKGMIFPSGYDTIMKWIFPFFIDTPPGYSCIFTHPRHRYDLPFLTIDGVVDTDKHIAPVNFPFFLKEGFVGKIDKGTPICQIIPFKRENWKSEQKEFNQKKSFIFENFFSVIEKQYKKNSWSKKSYR
jgi:hypothetical protein